MWHNVAQSVEEWHGFLRYHDDTKFISGMWRIKHITKVNFLLKALTNKHLHGIMQLQFSCRGGLLVNESA